VRLIRVESSGSSLLSLSSQLHIVWSCSHDDHLPYGATPLSQAIELLVEQVAVMGRTRVCQWTERTNLTFRLTASRFVVKGW